MRGALQKLWGSAAGAGPRWLGPTARGEGGREVTQARGHVTMRSCWCKLLKPLDCGSGEEELPSMAP